MEREEREDSERREKVCKKENSWELMRACREFLRENYKKRKEVTIEKEKGAELQQKKKKSQENETEEGRDEGENNTKETHRHGFSCQRERKINTGVLRRNPEGWS